MTYPTLRRLVTLLEKLVQCDFTIIVIFRSRAAATTTPWCVINAETANGNPVCKREHQQGHTSFCGHLHWSESLRTLSNR